MIRFEVNSDLSDQETTLKQMMQEHTEMLAEAQAGEEKYKDSQDWLDTDIEAGEEQLLRIERKAQEIRRNADAFVLIGIGGSNNAARAVVEALKPLDGCEIIYA
ncbi:MAG: glucose-6-phosphate isomerase, partial [Oribacterium sp.]|nr:glucose-6-phosphate isomerase [Oribacterium sp.]